MNAEFERVTANSNHAAIVHCFGYNQLQPLAESDVTVLYRQGALQIKSECILGTYNIDLMLCLVVATHLLSAVSGLIKFYRKQDVKVRCST